MFKLNLFSYMHVAGDIAEFDDLAELRSPLLRRSSSDCQLVFYYWLVGDSTGSLELYSSNSTTAIWSKSNSTSKRWHKATVNVGANPENWRLTFKLQPRVEFFGVWNDDVAIDDISFAQCSANRTRSIIDCDFEQDFCSWETKGLANFEWSRTSMKTPSSNTGPPGDHTTGSGYYIFIEASSPQKSGDRAWLRSPQLPATTSNCLEFYYHM